MRIPTSSNSRAPRRAASLFAACLAASALVAREARAHFVLDAPACYSAQSALGDPQKSAPCGQADPGLPAQPTDAVTTVEQGGALTLTLRETIFHPGHYRVAIARDPSGLPRDPPVTPDSSSACGSTPIDRAPTLPVLADGVLVHTAAFSGAQTVQIPLPADFTCERCVVQVTEFMSEHGLNATGGCFYHHCATVTVRPHATRDAGSAPDAATSTDAGVARDAAGPVAPSSGGCSVRAAMGARGGSAWALGALFAGVLTTRRRRRFRAD